MADTSICKEVWKDIEGYEGKYQVNNFGVFKRLEGYYFCGHRGEQKRYIPEMIMKQYKNQKGYPMISLSNGNKRKNYLAHRVVMETFVPNPDNLPQVNHKDENKENNFIWINEDGSVDVEKSNLEWCTNDYNINYGTGRIRAAAKMRGKTISEEHKKKISIANSGANNGMYGKPSWNKGQKGLQTAWNKGVPRSEETKRKISETKRKRYAL